MRKFLSIAFILMGYLVSHAQDAQFSQMIWNNIYLNPAQAGTDSSDNRLFAIYRDQWRQANAPFMSTNITYDRAIRFKNTQKHHLGVGGSLFYDRAGSANLSNLLVEAIVSYSYKFNQQKQRISLGLSAGYGNRSLDPSKLIFTDEGDGMGGEVISKDQMHLSRLVTGVHFSSLLKDKGSFDIGFTVFNPHQPSGTFFNTETVQNARYTAYTKFNFNAGDKWQIQPSFIHNSQAKNNQELVQLLAAYEIKDWQLWFGPGYRFGDAVIGYVGAEFKQFRAGFSYDQNISDFRRATNGIGAFEVSLSYAWNKKVKPEPLKEIVPEVIEEVEEVVDIEESIVEVIPDEPVAPVVVVEEPVMPELKKKFYESGQKIMLYFEHDRPKKAEQVDYQSLLNEYKGKSGIYVEKYGNEAQNFFDQDVVKQFDQFAEIASYMLEVLEDGHVVQISVKGFASNVGAADYNKLLTERRIQTIRAYLLQYDNGALKPYVEKNQLKIVMEPLGIQAKSQLAKEEDPIYSPNVAKDRKVELTIERIVEK